jgi:hypothetical protein
MPSWKKVITSGSAAAFSSLIVSNTITGSISGSLTGSLQGTASWAQFVVNAPSINTSSLVTTSSFNAFTSSIHAFTASYNTGSFTGSFTGSLLGTASYALVARQLTVGVFDVLPTGSSGETDIHYVTVMRRNTTGAITTNILAATASLVYSSSIDTLLTTASWAKNTITASYALTAPGILPGGNSQEIQFNDNNTFNGVPTLTFDGSTITATDITATGRFDGNLRLGVFRGGPINVPAITTKGEEVLVYSQLIPAGTFTDNDVMRVRYRLDNNTSDTAIYRIYISDDSDFTNVSGSVGNLVATCTASSAIRYVQIKRDLSFNLDIGRIEFFSASISATTDDTISTGTMSSYTMDWANADYYMYFSALPNSVSHICKAKYFSIERI